MPNLTLKVDQAHVPKVQALLPQVTDLTIRHLGAARPNVMLTPMIAGQGGSAVYAELVYLRSAERPDEAITAYGKALADLLSLSGTRVSFRGFPVGQGEIVPVDLETA